MSANPFHTPPLAGDNGPMRPPMNMQSKRMRLNSARRYVVNHLVTGLAVLSTLLVIAPLVAILIYLIYKGASSLNLAFFTHIPAPVGEPGGGICMPRNQITAGAPTMAACTGTRETRFMTRLPPRLTP